MLGTSTGSAQSIMDFTRDSLVQEKPFFVDPMRFPNTVMNCAVTSRRSGTSSRAPTRPSPAGGPPGCWPSTTPCGSRSRATPKTVLFGAVEEFSAARAWLEWHTRGQDESGTVLGEGAAVLLLESDEVAEQHGRDGLAEVLGLECGVHHEPGTEATVLADCVRRVLARTGVRPDEVGYLSTSGAAAERDALAEVLGDHEPEPVRCSELIGDTHAAAAAFQIAAVLVAAEGRDDARGRIALITSVDRDGVVGCAVLRLC